LDNLRNVGVLTKLANESAHVALNLLAANKDRVKQLDDDAAGIGGPAVPVFNITMTQG
jgi:hypothetical protein